ncbi:MAG TPA: hypothetical protein VFJ81_15575 [Gemmatimonadales bacterium]|nr:hypothetical protein [Gemmatimonadales bacterium]
MTTPSSSRASRLRQRGPIASVMPIAAALAAMVGCHGSDSAPAAHGAAASSAASAPGAPDTWMNRWHKETFDGQDSRKLWDQFSRAARAELSKPGADPSDLNAKASALGADPETVFEFIRDQITLEPYAGVLRGARGTLAAGAGNALDRALLAKELLRIAGIDSRLVSGTLSEAQADTLLARFLNSSQVPKVLADLIAVPTESDMKEQEATFAATFGLPEKAAADLADHARDQARDFWATTNAQSSSQFDSLASRLRQTSLKMAVDAGPLTAMLKERLRHHYWLQVRDPSGGWSAFDAAFADQHRGIAHGSGAVVLTDAPDSLYHKLDISLIYQSLTDGAPKEDTVVSGTYASADALFQSIAFHIQPTDLGADAHAILAMDTKTKITTLRSARRFQGLLLAGDKVTAGRKFDFEGNTYDATSGPLLKPAGGTFADALGGAESPLQFVELRVVMRLTGPGREPMVQNRTLVTGADLASGHLVPPILEWEILLQPQWIPGDFVALRTLAQVVATGDAVMRAAKGDRSLANVRSPTSASPLTLQMALLRQKAAASILAAQSGVRAFIDAPMLTITGHHLTGIDSTQGVITAGRTFDIVENGVRYVPTSEAAATTAFEAALKQGVADCTLEDRILRENYPRAVPKSAMTVVQQAEREKRSVLLAKTQDIDALRSTGVTETDINWIHDNEPPDSRLVVATTTDGLDAWWSVRPTGTTILRTNGGRGQAQVEYIVPLVDAVMMELCAFEVLDVIREKVETGKVEAGAGIAAFLCFTNMVGGKLIVAGIGHGAGILAIESTFLGIDIFEYFTLHAMFD